MSPARFRWGMILILTGILLFLQNLDLLSYDFWENMILFLPILLIAIGIEKIFTRSKLQFISYMTSFLILAAGLVVAFTGRAGEGLTGYFSESHLQRFNDKDVKRISAEFDLKETALTIRDSGDDLVYATFDRYTRKPEQEFSVENGEAFLKLISRGGEYLGGIVKVESIQDWTVRFSNLIPLHFICRGDGADVHLNMATTPLEELDLDLNESIIYLKLGDIIPRSRVQIRGDDSELKLLVPEHIGVKINADGYDSYFEHIGMVRSDGWFVNKEFDSHSSQVEIDLNGHLNSFSIVYF